MESKCEHKPYVVSHVLNAGGLQNVVMAAGKIIQVKPGQVICTSCGKLLKATGWMEVKGEEDQRQSEKLEGL